MLPPYEQLGLFYLGRKYDAVAGSRLAEPLLYDSRDLVTHAVCVGMTGSGKTGLGVILIEEAALDGVPVLAIDPKGDLSNLLLTFPDLDAAGFAPWIDPGEVRARQTSTEALAAEIAARWKAGLEEWDQDGRRVERLRAAADVRVYTPGSRIGIPLSLLKTLGGASADPEQRAARAATVAASLLSLAGIAEAGPHSREQALLAAILAEDAAPTSTDLVWLMEQIQRPPMSHLGVLDLETFFPARDRQELALRFNSVIAMPGFDAWIAGEPLDIGTMLFTPSGKPRISIISIAHLDDSQRMMAVSLVLNAIVEWSRSQAGTSSLRAMVYMDEVFGFLPPVANPPSKLPLLTLLKQARASGVGVVLATQNPVDLDYKALSNSGTWFLGRLQTERDKTRLLDGLRSISSGLSTADLEDSLSRLRKRVFLMHSVHEEAPVTFETRWTLSYLRGPLTRDELRRLSAPADASRAVVPPVPSTGVAQRPIVPAGIPEFFVGGTRDAVYEPVLYGSARVHYQDEKRGVDLMQDVHALVPFSGDAVPVDWSTARETSISPEALERAPAGGSGFATLPAAALNPRSYVAWEKDMANWLTRSRPLRLFSAPAHRLFSQPGETEAQFVARVRHAVREDRDTKVDALRARYATRIARATARVEKATDAVEREEQQAHQQKLQTAVSIGATVLGALMGRKAVSMSTLGRATTAARGAGRTAKEMEDIVRARERLRESQEEFAALEKELQDEIDALTNGPQAAKVETVDVKPRRGAVSVRLVALVWRAGAER